jgi:hypothetical protein
MDTTILVVDDAAVARRWCAEVLQAKGYRVELAEDGEEAVRKVFDRAPSLVIMDLEMPRMDGVSAIRLLKSNPQSRHIPILAFTSRSSVEERVRVLEAGADDFLSKEADEAELIARVRSLLRVEALEQEILEERNRFSAVLDQLAEAVMLCDERGRLVLANQAAMTILGIPPEIVGSLSLEELLQGVRRGGEFLDRLHRDELDAFEILFPTPTGPRTFQVSGTPWMREGRGREGWILVFRDVTREREMEKMRSAFYSMIAHDLRSPITVVTGYVSLLLQGKAGDLTDTQREFLDAVLQRVKDMLKLVDEFLTVSKLEAMGIELKVGEVDLEELLREVLDSLELIAENKGIRVRLEKEGEVPTIMADRDKLQKVFTNLYDNALKYTPEGGEVTVRLWAVPAGVEVEVRDSGIGMNPEEMSCLFDRFTRLSTAKNRKIKGTGLGLAIVKEIVEAHGGRVWAESEEGKGSSFFVVLPLGRPAGRETPQPVGT